MVTATFNLSKSITIIEGCKLSIEKYGNFGNLIMDYGMIVFMGITTPARFNKCKKTILDRGFEIAKTLYVMDAGIDGMKTGDVKFRIVFKKKDL